MFAGGLTAMADVRLVWQAGLGIGDLRVEGVDLERDDGLETAVLVSMFTDRRVSAEELPRGESDRRGWWGDVLADVDGDEIGSKIWLLERSKQSNEALVFAEEYTREALAWMIEDGIAVSVDAAARWVRRGILELCASDRAARR